MDGSVSAQRGADEGLFDSVPRRIRQWSHTRPDRPAIIEGVRTTTYGQLAIDIDQLAARLAAAGVTSGDTVGLCLPRSADLVVAAAAVLHIGANYLCVDTDVRSRVRHILDDANPTAVIVRGCADIPVDTSTVAVVTIDGTGTGTGTGIPVEGHTGPTAPVRPSDVAYLTYTSGSTGAPKGVVVEHGSLANLVDWHGECYGTGTEDRMPQLASPTFDAFALEVWPCLAHGASLLIASPGTVTSPGALAAWLVDHDVTLCFVPTPLAMGLFALPVGSTWPPRSRLRAMLVGGDRLTRRPPPGLPFRVVNNYGPTEFTVVATWCEVSPDPYATEPPPIGRPIRNATAYVLDPRLTAVPAGEPGELYLAGAGVARGYHGQPGLTAASFLRDPFDGTTGRRMYRTGDLVRRDDDGTLHFLGRIDDQVKVNGVRIEPAEVETALLRIGWVRAATVVARHLDPAEPVVLVAYIVTDRRADEPVDPGPDTPDITGRIRRELAAHLPDQLLPARVVVVDALPTTCHGKVDRAALRAAPPPPQEEAPIAPDAHPLVTAWREALDLDEVDPEANFFEVGGNSLRMIRLITRARQRGLSLRPEDVGRNPVLRDLLTSIGTTA